MCNCIVCSECNGTGSVWRSLRGEYLGKMRCDDMDELESCDCCGGTGIADECEGCEKQRAEEEAGA